MCLLVRLFWALRWPDNVGNPSAVDLNTRINHCQFDMNGYCFQQAKPSIHSALGFVVRLIHTTMTDTVTEVDE